MMLTATIRDDNGQTVGVLVLSEKVFSSGARGFFGQGKITIDGQRYQGQAQLVAIRSKAAPEGDAAGDLATLEG